MLKTETLLTERPSSFSALINAESGDFLVSIFFPNQGAKGSLYFFFSPLTTHFYSFESLIYE